MLLEGKNAAQNLRHDLPSSIYGNVSLWTDDAGGSMRRFAEAAVQGTGGIDCAVVSGGVAARCNKVCQPAPSIIIAEAHRAHSGQGPPLGKWRPVQA